MTDTIFINGCFDILHVGHIKFFEFCEYHRQQRNACLIIALDSDRKIQKDKGPQRPFFSWGERKSQISSISSIIRCDSFLSFSTNQELESLIKNSNPILIKGERWKGNVVGEEYAKEIIYCPDFPGLPSTTEIEDRIMLQNRTLRRCKKCEYPGK